MAKINDDTLCYVSRANQTVIDTIDPETGRGTYGGRTLDDAISEYPDAEIMTISEFCDWKAEQQRTPIKWVETTESEYEDMLNCLPPAAFEGSAFLVGEPYDHDAGNGKPRFTAYRIMSGQHFVSSRPMTISEFRARP